MAESREYKVVVRELQAAIADAHALFDEPLPPWWRFLKRRERYLAIDQAIARVSFLNRLTLSISEESNDA